MNLDPDYSAAYVILNSDAADHRGFGMTFTIGRGNELCVAAIRVLAQQIIGSSIDSLMSQPVELYRRLTGDSQLRWVGPEKGVIHLAAAAVINAVWDLWARTLGLPLWRAVCQMPVEQLAASIDHRYLTDVLSYSRTVELLNRSLATRQNRIEQLEESGYPSYTTSAGWLGYSDEVLAERCRDLTDRGWKHFKIKVGRDLADDHRRCRAIREHIGDDNYLMIDANQVWDVPEAISWIQELAEYKPWFVEEPTSPDDILGHAAIARAVHPLRIATGEMCHNRVMFKQFLQSGGMQVCQLDSCRLGGVNEVLAVLLLAAEASVPVCPHAGGVGLCEYVQHISMIDYVCVSASLQDRITEYSDHLHEHMTDPVKMKNGHYMPPSAAGYGVRFTEDAISTYAV